MNPKEVLNSQVKEAGAEIPMEDTQAIEKIEDGYHIKSKEIQNVKLKISEEAQQECGRCLRCDHYGFGVFKGGRTTKW